MNNFVLVAITCLFFPSTVVGENVRTQDRHKSKLTGYDDIVASFEKLGAIVESIGDESKLTLYEGLPHQFWGAELLKSELKTKDTIVRFGFASYQKPNEVSEGDTLKLRALVKGRKSFRRFGGVKFCGGYHPDFSLVWNVGDEEVEFHVCLGCGEIKAYYNKVEVYCDISKNVFEDFEKVLRKYHEQFPIPNKDNKTSH